MLTGYKELLLRYEALSRALQHQLGLGGGEGASEAATAANGAGTPVAAGPAGAAPAASPGHRSKVQQQQAGFGSLILQGADAGLGAARRALSAPMHILPGNGRTSPASSSAANSAEASPSGKWSPGGILQRISRGARRSQTPPRDRSGERAAVASAAAAAAAAAPEPSGGSASSAGKGHPLISTLFGSPRQHHQQPPPQQQQPAAAVPGLPAEAGSDPDAAAAAAAAAAAGAEPSFHMEDLLRADGGLGSPLEQPQQPGSTAASEQREAPAQLPAGASVDLIQLGEAAGGAAAADPLLGGGEAAGGTAEQQQLQEQQQQQPLPHSDGSLI